MLINHFFIIPLLFFKLGLFSLGSERVPSAFDSPTLIYEMMKNQRISQEIKAEKTYPEIQVLEFSLQNGMKVCLKPTTFEENEVLVRVEAVGGFACLNENQRASAELAPKIAWESGLGKLSIDQLSIILYEHSIDLSMSVTPYRRSVSGSASVDEMEKFFELIHMLFTKSNFTLQAFNDVLHKAKVKSSLSSLERETDLFALKPLTIKDLEKADFATSKKFFEHCFADPSEFTCVIVGSFRSERMKELITRYLASIPKNGDGLPKKNQIFPEFPKAMTAKIKHLSNKKDSVTKLTIPLNIKLDEQKKEKVDLACQVIKVGLERVFSENERDLQGINVRHEIPFHPFLENSWITIEYNSSPSKVNQIAQVILRELKNLQLQGPLVQDFERAQELMATRECYWLKDNEYWLTALSDLYLSEWNPTTILSGGNPKMALEEMKNIVAICFDLDECSIVTAEPPSR
jgi:zinc protease